MRRPESINDRKENCLCAIQGVGMASAKKLLTEFGSIKEVAEASEESLMKIDKIGEKQAKNIKDTLN